MVVIAVVLLDGGLAFMYWEELAATDGLVGFSCGSSATSTEIDITSEMANLPYGAPGIGNGIEDFEHELFVSDNDLDYTHAFFCVPNGSSDADGDGWTVDCGDTDDADASVYPY